MNDGFENVEAFAKMNYLIDVIRGNVTEKRWSDLDKKFRKMYLDEAKIATYVITNADMNQIENRINPKAEPWSER